MRVGEAAHLEIQPSTMALKICLSPCFLMPTSTRSKCLNGSPSIPGYIFKIVFKKSFGFTERLSNWYRDFLYIFCPQKSIVFPIINILQQRGSFISTDESASTHHYHPETVIYTMAHSWPQRFLLTTVKLEL